MKPGVYVGGVALLAAATGMGFWLARQHNRELAAQVTRLSRQNAELRYELKQAATQAADIGRRAVELDAANQAAADAHLIAAGWTGSVRDREVDPDAAKLGRALALVVREVESARLKHGRGFPGGWGPHARAEDVEARQRAQDACDAAQGSGGASFRDVAEEEVAEVYAEAPGSAEHVRELAQVAAVYVRGMLFADFFRRVRESMGSEVQGE